MTEDTGTNAEQGTGDAPDQTNSQKAAVNGQGAATDGVRARRAFMLKFLLGGEGGDWINKNIVAKGKGTQQIVGRIYGVCMGTERKSNVLPDGGVSESIVLYGQFEYESAVTGEIGQASSAYLPMAYAQQVATVFASQPDTKALEVDVDIGLEATGKTIPYEWLVINHAGVEASLLTKLRSRRRPGQKALAAPAEQAAPALAAPTSDAKPTKAAKVK